MKKKKLEIVQVIAPYTATGAEQLSLEVGQLIQVRKKNETGWWEGELQAKGKKKQVGWFPASFVKSLAGGSTASSGKNTPVPDSSSSGKDEPEIGMACAAGRFFEFLTLKFLVYPQNASWACTASRRRDPRRWTSSRTT